jgi:arylsulfatase
MSDNGPEGQDKVGPLSRDVITDWVDSVSNPALEAIGRGDVWAFTGTNWTIAQLGVMNWFKWFIGEGGVRVPAIVVPPAGVDFARSGERTAEFATVKDISATILDYAGVERPGATYKGRDITPASGSTLRGFLQGKTEQPHDESYRHVLELFGNGYVVQGDYKAMMIREGMWGDGEWHLFDIRNDPGETTPIDNEKPELLADLKAHFESYREEKGLVPVSDNWSPWFGFVDLDTFNK